MSRTARTAIPHLVTAALFAALAVLIGTSGPIPQAELTGSCSAASHPDAAEWCGGQTATQRAAADLTVRYGCNPIGLPAGVVPGGAIVLGSHTPGRSGPVRHASFDLGWQYLNDGDPATAMIAPCSR